MVASIGKGTVAQYYLRRTEYYLNGKEPAGVWLSTSVTLGIKVGQVVDADLFEKLHAGIGPDGRSLITNDGGKKRMPGFDLTLSAPKSVSIAFALADPDMRAAIERIQLEACKAVIAMLNREAAFTRRGRNGVIIEKTSLIVAAFQHGEARPAPPCAAYRRAGHSGHGFAYTFMHHQFGPETDAGGRTEVDLRSPGRTAVVQRQNVGRQRVSPGLGFRFAESWLSS